MKNPFHCRFIILVLYVVNLNGWGNLDPHWRFWTASDGLIESWVPFISISPSGNIICLHGRPINQISYLNGYQVEQLPYIKSIDASYNRVVFQSINGQYWSNQPNGVQYYKENQWVQYDVDPFDHSTCKILPGATDSVYILSPYELRLVNVSENVTTVIQNASMNGLGLFNEIIYSPEGDVWIAAQYGAACIRGGIFDPKDQFIWEEFSFRHLNLENLHSILIDDHGNVIGTASSTQNSGSVIAKLTNENWEIVYSAEKTFDTGWPDDEGNIWLLTFQLDYLNLDYLSLWNGSVVSETNVKFPSNDQVWAFESNQSFWTKTSRNVARYAAPVWRTPSSLKNIDTYINSINQDDLGRIWMTTVNQLVLLDGDKRRIYPLPKGFRSYQHGSEDISFLQNGDIGIRTERPFILQFSPDKEKFNVIVHPEGKPILATFDYGNGYEWVQIGNEHDYQLDLYDGTVFRTVISRRNDWNIGELRYIFHDQNGDVWLGGMSEKRIGLYQNGVYKTMGDQYPGNAAITILRQQDGSLLVSDRNNIFRYDGTQWENIHPHVDQVHSMIQAEDGTVWVASWSGLYRYVDGSWIQNTVEDGLPTTDCMEIFEDQQNRIWVGTYHGPSLYHPGADLDPPETQLLNVKNLYEVPPNGEARFVFSGMDKWKYTPADRLYYSYQLNNGDWSDFMTGTVATIQDLAPGTHQFAVRAMDRNFNIDPTPEQTTFLVLLPWYQERGFIMISAVGTCIILVLISVVIHRHFRLRYLVQIRTADLNHAYEQLKIDTLELEKAESKLRSMASELTYAEERERRRIATMLHDGIGHVLAFAKIKLSSLKQILEPKKKKDVGDVIELINQMIDDTHSLTFELSPPVLHELGFERAVQWLLEEFRKKHEIRFSFEVHNPVHTLSEDISILLFQSVRELLVNVVKHAEAEQVQLTIEQNNGFINVSLHDNGVGFDVNQIQPDQIRGYGLFSIQQRFKYYGGFVRIDSQLGNGTTITLSAPMNALEETHDKK